MEPPEPGQPPPLPRQRIVQITPDMLAAPEPIETRVDFERDMSIWPLVCIALIGINIVVFAWELGSGALLSEQAIIGAGALHRQSVLDGQVWRVITAMFLHGHIPHLVGNCIVLYILGLGCEHAFGWLRAFTIYMLAGIGGSILSLAMSPGPGVGASGAVFGLLGALIVFLHRFRNLFFVRDKRIGVVLLCWAIYQIVTGFLDPQIDNFAHIGGFTAGACAAAIFKSRIKPPAPGFAIQVAPPRAG